MNFTIEKNKELNLLILDAPQFGITEYFDLDENLYNVITENNLSLNVNANGRLRFDKRIKDIGRSEFFTYSLALLCYHDLIDKELYLYDQIERLSAITGVKADSWTIDHLDGCKRNNTSGNLVLMPKRNNSQKGGIFSTFVAPYYSTCVNTNGRFRVLLGVASNTNMTILTGDIKKRRGLKLYICDDVATLIELLDVFRNNIETFCGDKTHLRSNMTRTKREADDLSIVDNPLVSIAFQRNLAAVPEECFTQVTPELLKNGVELII